VDNKSVVAHYQAYALWPIARYVSSGYCEASQHKQNLKVGRQQITCSDVRIFLLISDSQVEC